MPATTDQGWRNSFAKVHSLLPGYVYMWWMLHLLTDLRGWEAFFIYAQQEDSENWGTLESNAWSSSMRILRLKNRRQLSLPQMEEDAVCLPEDGGPGHTIYGFLSGDKKAWGPPSSSLPSSPLPAAAAQQVCGPGQDSLSCQGPFPGLLLPSCWAGSQVASNPRREVAAMRLGVPESKHPLLDSAPCLW